MAVNRFLNVNWSQPISSFVPRPFEAAYMAGKQVQEDLDNKLSKLDTSTDPFEKLNLRASLKIYDPNAPGGIRDYDLGSDLENQKIATVNALAQERQKIVNDLSDGKIDQNEFNRQVAKHITKSKTAYNILSSAGAAAEKIRKHNEDVVAKSKEFGTTPYYGEELLKYNTDFVNRFATGDIGDYVGVNIADKFESEKDLNEHAKGFEESGQGYAGLIDGYIKDVQTKGVTGTRVYDYARNNWDNSTRKIYSDLKVKDYLFRSGLDPAELIDHTTYQRSADKAGNIIEKEVKVKVPRYEALMDNEFTQFHNALADKVVHGTRIEHMKGDPYSLSDYQDQKTIDAFQSSIVESGANVYDTVPETLKKYTDASGNLTLETLMQNVKNRTNLIIVPGKGSFRSDQLPEGYSITKPMGMTATQYLVDPEGNRSTIIRDTRPSEEQVNANIKEVNIELDKLANRYGLDVVGKDFNTKANAVLKLLNKNSITVSRGVNLDPDVSESVTKDIIGTDKKASKLHFVDMYDIAHKKKLPGDKFVEENDIDPNSLNMLDYDFTAPEPGTKTFAAKSTDGKTEKILRVTTRDIKEQNHFKPAYSIIQDLQKFNQNKDIETKKTNITTSEGAKDFIVIGKPIVDFDGASIQAIYDPKGEEQFIARKDKQGNTQLIAVDDYKTYVVDKYYKEGQGKSHLRGISNKYGNVATINLGE